MGNIPVKTKRMGLLCLLGCVITAIGILWLATQGCSRQAVKHWHTEKLTEEFTAERIPEIADRVVEIDRAMRWGFGFELGPFELWDALSIKENIDIWQNGASGACRSPRRSASVIRATVTWRT